MHRPKDPTIFVTFPSELGWMALVDTGSLVKRLTFGHASSRAAVAALDRCLLDSAMRGTFNADLVGRLQAFVCGTRDDFRDVRIDLGHLGDFQRRVIRHCRRIRYGSTMTYGQLAAQAGSPRAARAVGNCMAANRFPLIVPCHRVLPASGRPGAFSAPGGTDTKIRLLALEAGKAAVE